MDRDVNVGPRRPKLISSVISDVKHIIYIYIFIIVYTLCIVYELSLGYFAAVPFVFAVFLRGFIVNEVQTQQ